MAQASRHPIMQCTGESRFGQDSFVVLRYYLREAVRRVACSKESRHLQCRRRARAAVPMSRPTPRSARALARIRAIRSPKARRARFVMKLSARHCPFANRRKRAPRMVPTSELGAAADSHPDAGRFLKP